MRLNSNKKEELAVSVQNFDNQRDTSDLVFGFGGMMDERSKLVQGPAKKAKDMIMPPSLKPRTKNSIQRNYKNFTSIEKKKPENYFLNKEFGAKVMRGSNPLHRTFGSPLNAMKDRCSRGLSNNMIQGKDSHKKIKAILMGEEDRKIISKENIPYNNFKKKRARRNAQKRYASSQRNTIRNEQPFDHNTTIKKAGNKKRKKIINFNLDSSKLKARQSKYSKVELSSRESSEFGRLTISTQNENSSKGKKCDMITLDKMSINVLFLVYSKDNNVEKALNFLNNSNVNADVNCVGGDGWGAIHYACMNKNFKYVNMLVYNECDVDLRGKGGVTALFLAILG